ncbi:MAG: xanthine dehydrogenase FAD-binding subunit XdhB, partial [Eubacterium aggregans]
ADKTTLEDVRIAYGVAGPIPMRVPTAEALVRGQRPTAALAKAFGQAVLEDINPRDSWRASKAFGCHIGEVVAECGLKKAITRAGGILYE